MVWCGDREFQETLQNISNPEDFVNFMHKAGGSGTSMIQVWFVNILDLARRECPMKTFRGRKKNEGTGWKWLQICFASLFKLLCDCIQIWGEKIALFFIVAKGVFVWTFSLNSYNHSSVEKKAY